MGTAGSTASYTFPCLDGEGMCVSEKHGIVIVSDPANCRLRLYSLDTGALVRSIGRRGTNRGEFEFCKGGLCLSPDGDSVLVAECRNYRVQQVTLANVAGSPWERYIGNGNDTRLISPDFVDCNADVVVVSETHPCFVSVLTWRTGQLLTRFRGWWGVLPAQMYHPCGIRILRSGNQLVVADCWNNRLCVFTLQGQFVREITGVRGCRAVLEWDDSFIVACESSHEIVRMSSSGSTLEVYGKRRIKYGKRGRRGAKKRRRGSGTCEFHSPLALAGLRDGRLVVLELTRVQVITGGFGLGVGPGLALRALWILACVRPSR